MMHEKKDQAKKVACTVFASAMMLYLLSGCAPCHRHYAGPKPAVPVQKKAYHYPSCLDDIVSVHGGKAIVVDKSEHELSLYRYAGSWELVASYEVALGKNKGDKRRQGDMRTPEGNYLVEEKMTTDSGSGHYSSVLVAWNNARGWSTFGNYALKINYPNAQDRNGGKTGSNILIHSTSRDSKLGKDITEGCITLEKSCMKALYDHVGERTPVLIRPYVHKRVAYR